MSFYNFHWVNTLTESDSFVQNQDSVLHGPQTSLSLPCKAKPSVQYCIPKII